MLTQDPTREATQGTPPKLLEDVGVWLFFSRGSRSEDVYTVGSITADRYLTVPGSKLPAVQAFMRRLDGQRTLQQVKEDLIREQGLQMDVEALHRKFRRAGLLEGPGAASGGDLQEMSTTILRLPIHRLLIWLHSLSPLAIPIAVLGSALITIAMLLSLLDSSFLQLMAKPVAAGWSLLGSAGMAVLIAAVSMLLHELSHCYAASYWDILAGTVKVQLYLGVIPIVGLKLAGLYTLPPKGRFAVWSAGVFINLSITAAALLALWTVAPGSISLELTAAINWLLAVFNLMPLLPTDGYFMLSTLVKDSNVRVRAWNWVRRPFHPANQRPSAFVLAYIISTVWLLISTMRHLTLRIVNAGSVHPVWQSVLAFLLLVLFLITLWRTFRRTEGWD